jgi:hypothetical protein
MKRRNESPVDHVVVIIVMKKRGKKIMTVNVINVENHADIFAKKR